MAAPLQGDHLGSLITGNQELQALGHTYPLADLSCGIHRSWRRPIKAGPSASAAADGRCKLGASLQSKITISQNFQETTFDRANHFLGIYLHVHFSWDPLPFALSALIRVLSCVL